MTFSNIFFNANRNTNYNNSNQNIKMQCGCKPVGYSKLVTAGNDPTISKKMQYASYVRAYGTTQAYNAGGNSYNNIGYITENPTLTQQQNQAYMDGKAFNFGVNYFKPLIIKNNTKPCNMKI
jgi:hypothetical protein